MATSEFPILNQILKLGEPDRRRLLRSHLEVGIAAREDLVTRRDLDAELDEIARLELRAEASDPSAEEALRSIPAFAELVRHSPAFFQYLNVYLYFSVRFAAGRALVNIETTKQTAAGAMPACADPPSSVPGPPSGFLSRLARLFKKLNAGQETALPAGEPPDCNDPALALPRPPAMVQPRLLDDVARFLALSDRDPALVKAQRFLDDFGPSPEQFELWLRGLNPSVMGTEREVEFKLLSLGLREWAFSRYRFYHSLEETPEADAMRLKQMEEFREGPWTEGVWRASNPLTARCGVNELYWLSKILRAEISPKGRVTYKSRSWLWYLAGQNLAEQSGSGLRHEILRAEEVLREVFGYACDLLQNALEIVVDTERRREEPELFAVNPPATTKDWRETYDQELVEIANQRKQRRYHPQKTMAMRNTQPVMIQNALEEGWSMRICTGEDVDNVVGLAFSGGGIRSATFNLGVLQRLKDLDLLRKVDCLSTVSGGGYIGAWLLGNVRRTHHWLGRLTNWEDSVSHLRSYSNYLAPHNGLLSVDTWTMWGTWIRNAILIQLTAVAWLMFLLAGTQGLERFFWWLGDAGAPTAAILALVLIVLTRLICRNLHKPQRTSGSWTPIAGAGLSWAAAFLAAALFWALVRGWNASDTLAYSIILGKLWETTESRVLMGVLVVCMFAIAWCSSSIAKVGRAVASLFVSAVGVGVMYLAFCGILRLFGEFRDGEGIWYAYVFGPALSLFAVSGSVIIFIGLMGRTAPDWTREWWTRFGSWMGILGMVFMALSLSSIFGPLWVKKVFALHNSVAWGTVLAWLGTVAGGLLAGNDTTTNGRRKAAGSSSYLEKFAVVGAVAFIVGSVLAVSTLLHEMLAMIFEDLPFADYWYIQNAITEPHITLMVLAALFVAGVIFSWRFEINVFGLNQFYRNRLVRCYLGATRWMPGMRNPHPFTGFDNRDEIPMDHLRCGHNPAKYNNEPFRGPFPIVNCTLNLGGSSDLAVHTRQSASFTITPLRCGFYRQKGGFAPTPPSKPNTTDGAYAGGVTLGQAIAVSGAAASPNMGYNTSPVVAFLLTMFNVRLGWWFPNPAGSWWDWPWLKFSLYYLVKELFGMADEGGRFVNVSDGGHFENLGIYELVRRRAKVIVAADAECDSELAFGSLGNVIRLCETDFGAKIDLDTGSIRKMADGDLSRAHCAVGRIIYSNGSQGYLIYLKASITGDESAEIEQYRSSHSDFPHQSTADQFFSEDQFESYRRLGYHIADRTFRGSEGLREMYQIAAKLFNLWAPAGFNSDAFIRHSKLLNELWDKFRESSELGALLDELMADIPDMVLTAPLKPWEKCMCLELLQLMECVFLDLRLDDFWDHPDNRGWAMLFSRWAKSPRLQNVWDQSRHTFGIRFEYFCGERLGLRTDNPVVRA